MKENRFEVREIATETGLIIFDKEKNVEITEAQWRVEVLNLLNKIAVEVLPK